MHRPPPAHRLSDGGIARGRQGLPRLGSAPTPNYGRQESADVAAPAWVADQNRNQTGQILSECDALMRSPEKYRFFAESSLDRCPTKCKEEKLGPCSCRRFRPIPALCRSAEDQKCPPATFRVG